MIGLASAILFALGFAAHYEIGRLVERDVEATSGVLAKILQERSAALEDQCSLLARQPVIFRVLKTRDSATIADSVREWLSQIRADSALVTDDTGRLLGKTDESAGENYDREVAAGVKRALDGRPWSGVLTRKEHLVLAVCVPITQPSDKSAVLGTFMASRIIDDRLASELKSALGANLAFVKGGNVLGASVRTAPVIPTPRKVPQVITTLGASYFAQYSPFPNSTPEQSIGFVVLRPYASAMALFYRFQLVFMLIAAGALMVSLMAAAGVSRSVTRPLDSVVEAANALKEGRWPDRFEVTREDEIGLLQSVFNEMTDSLQAAQERMLALIDADPLTGLKNHRRFIERLAQEVPRCRGANEPLSLLLLNVDGFKEYNRHYGHAAGDVALSKIAEILQDAVPEVAVTARYSGDVFAVLLPLHSAQQAERVAMQIRARVAEFWQSGRSGSSPTFSTGCASLCPQVAEGEALVLAAELAVSQAKELGRDRVCCFEDVAWGDVGDDPYKLHRFLKDGSLATIQALAVAVDAKDPYTQGHSSRVSQLAADLGAFIGLSDSEVEVIRIAGTLHDVGKIGVPDAILSKVGRLTDIERDIMETHPVLGEVIVRKAPQLGAMLPGVRNHHERWDGRGYPDGLKGLEIPLIARIIALADTFDAITSDRPYRDALPAEAALAEIARHAGRQFDPELVQLFLVMMSSRVRHAVGAELAGVS